MTSHINRTSAVIVAEHGTSPYAILALHALSCRAGLVMSESPVLQVARPDDGYDALSAAMRQLLRTDRALRERAVNRGARSPDLVTHGVAQPDQIVITDAAHASALLADVKLVLYVGGGEPPKWLVALAPDGLLHMTDGVRGIGGRIPSHLEMLVEGAPTVLFELWHHHADGTRLRVFASQTQARGVSPAVHDELCVLRSADLLTLVAERLLTTGETPWRQPVVPREVSARAAADAGATGSALRLFTRRAGASLRARGAPAYWGLAYRRTHEEPLDAAVRLLQESEPLLPPTGAQWADPFPVRHEGRDLVFFEQELPGEPHAHVAMMELFGDGRHSSPERVLEGPGHLSYPGVFRHEGEWFMIPESATSCVVSLYRAVDFPHRWIKECDLITDRQIVDPTVLQHNGRWWLLGGRVGADKAPFEDLEAFSSPVLTGPWTPHPLNPLVSDAYSGRPAGNFMLQNGVLVRPAQDCSVAYGHGLSFQRVGTLTPDDYAEEVITRRSADWSAALSGVHTFNRSETLTWVDLRWRGDAQRAR